MNIAPPLPTHSKIWPVTLLPQKSEITDVFRTSYWSYFKTLFLFSFLGLKNRFLFLRVSDVEVHDHGISKFGFSGALFWLVDNSLFSLCLHLLFLLCSHDGCWGMISGVSSSYGDINPIDKETKWFIFNTMY